MTKENLGKKDNKKFLIIGGIAVIVVLVLIIVFALSLGSTYLSGTMTDTGSEIETLSADPDDEPALTESQKEFKAKLDNGEFSKTMLSSPKVRVIEDLSVLTDKELYGNAEIGFEIVQSSEGIFLYNPNNEELVSYRLKKAQ